MNDGTGAIPIHMGVQKTFQINYFISDAGYDYSPIYKQLYWMKSYSILTYKESISIRKKRMLKLAQIKECDDYFK
ncbi:hypothetical protein NLX69_07905 [Rossellomorea sp. BNER]|nr:hypothetical protein [Rossellomorea sp. BNER]